MTLLADIQQWESNSIKLLSQSYIDKGFEASGNWPKELEWVNTITPFRTNLKLYGANYTEFMIHGRGPTSSTGPYQDGPNLQSQIEQWIKDKGLSLNPYAVTKKIHKEGTKQFRNPDPNKKRLLDDAIPENSFNDLIDLIRKDTASRLTINLQKTFT